MNLIKLVCLCLFFIITHYSIYAQEFIQGSEYFTEKLNVDKVEIYVHFPKHKLKFKKRVEKVLKSKLSYFHQYFNYRPQSQVHIVINEFANDANGMATVFPYNIINLNDFAALDSSYLNSTNDWVEQLVIHEYVHILTMDMTSGYVDFFRNFLGSMVKTNGIMPAWLLEGVAVWAESRDAPFGRANSSMVNYEVYLQLSNTKNCTDVTCLDFPSNYPFGNLRYWVGGVFLSYLEKQKTNTLSCIFNKHSSQIPFLLNGVFEHCYGKNVDEAFGEFRQSFLTKYKSLQDFCPLKSKSNCQKLKENNFMNKVNWQLGNCDNLVVIQDKDEAHNESQALEILNIDSMRKIKTSFPIRNIQKINNKCLVSLNQFTGQIFESIYYNLRDNELEKIEYLNNSEVIAAEKDTFHPVNYVNGNWVLKKDKKSYFVSDELSISEIKLNNNIVTYKNQNSNLISKKLTNLSFNNSKISLSDYQAYKYLKPNYLMVLFSNNGNLNSTNIITGLVDPVRRHSFDFQFDLYEDSEINSPVPRFMSYQYKLGQSAYSVGYTKSYSFSLFNNSINESQGLFVNYQKTFINSFGANSFFVSFLKQDLEDFISKRTTFTSELGHFLRISNNKADYWYNTFELNTLIGQTNVEGYNPFYGIKFNVASGHNLGSYLKLSNSLKLSKYFKDDLRRGFYSGGGFSSFLTGNVNHQFFAVNQGDIFGNEILSARINADYNLFNIYNSQSLLPAYLRNISFVSGLEYAKSKYIAVGNTLYKENYASSLYYGLNFNSIFFYGVPTSIKIIVTNLVHPTTYTGALLFFNASLF